MQCFQVPLSTARHVDKICRNFFWKKADCINGLAMISWDKICRPKKFGGLNLRKMEAVNSAFLSKLTWKLFHDKSLWVEQMKVKYSLAEDFFMINSRSSDSWV